jgi:hypothetical protein
MPRVVTAATATFLIALTGIAFASPIDTRHYPESTCAVDPATATLTVVSSNTRVVVKRLGDEIAVSEGGTGRRTCSGPAPTVQGIDLIRIEASTGALVELDLRRGPLAPGATDEHDGSSEIEIEADLEFADLSVHGSAGAEWVSAGAVGDRAAMNLDAGEADPDADVMFTGRSATLSIAGKGGDDVISGGGGPGFSGGFPGDFEAAAGSGDDEVTGSPGADALKAGGGQDSVRGLGGQDSIYTRDGIADRVRCGPGTDYVDADRDDSLSGCERTGF